MHRASASYHKLRGIICPALSFSIAASFGDPLSGPEVAVGECGTGWGAWNARPMEFL